MGIARKDAMRKTVAKPSGQHASAAENNWLDLESIAEVEVSSEHPEFPIDSTLTEHGSRGWRADQPGVQTVVLKFDEPQQLKRI